MSNDADDNGRSASDHSRSSCSGSMDRRWLLAALCIYCTVQSGVANGLVPAVLSTIERRFALSTTHLAFIMAAYDVAYIAFVAPVSYFGGRHRKPLFLAAGLACIALGSLTFSMPYFLTMAEEHGVDVAQTETGALLCPYSDSVSSCRRPNATSSTWPPPPPSDRAYIALLAVFVVAHALHGAGATPLFTVGVSYLHENVSKKMSSVYIGTFYSFVIFGPALGFIASSVFLQLPANFWLTEASYKGGHATVGAWYLGFLIASATGFLFVPLLATFPATLNQDAGAAARTPESATNGTTASCVEDSGGTVPRAGHSAAPTARSRLDRIDSGESESEPEVNSAAFGVLSNAVDSMAHCKRQTSVVSARHSRKSSVAKQLKQDLAHVPHAFTRLFTNPVFLLVSVAACGQGLLITGISTFMAKYIEKQFSVPAARSSLLIGVIMVPLAGLGTMLSGWALKRWHVRVRPRLAYAMLAALVSACLLPMFLVYCDTPTMAGVDEPYNARPGAAGGLCNAHCSCAADGATYRPVCTVRNGEPVAYYSPCHAGCATKTDKEFTNCTCAYGMNGISEHVSEEKCDAGCGSLPIFLVIFAPLCFVSFTMGIPLLTATLRVVPREEQSFALGIQWIVLRSAGNLPAPLIYGSLFDRTCARWESDVRPALDQCNMDTAPTGRGACVEYDNGALAHAFLIASLVAYSFTALVLLVSLIVATKWPPNEYESDDLYAADEDADLDGTAKESSL